MMGVFIGAVIGMIAFATLDRALSSPDADVQITHSGTLDADVVSPSHDTHYGPMILSGCLVSGAFCIEQWLPYESIDTIAALSYEEDYRYGACFLGCLYVNRGYGWFCERHVFYLSFPRHFR